MTRLPSTPPAKGPLTRFWTWLTLWAEAVERSETTILEERIMRVEIDLAALQADRGKPCGDTI